MAVTTAALSGSIKDLGLEIPDHYLARVVLVVEANTPGSLLRDTSGNTLLAGAKRVTVDKTTGTFSQTLVTTNSADIQPADDRLYKATLIYPSGKPGAKNELVESGWFPFTADASLADAWQGIEVTAVSTALYESISTSVASAEASAVAAAAGAQSSAASATLAQTLVTSDLGTTDGQTWALVTDPNSQTTDGLRAGYITINEAPLDPYRYGYTGDGVSDEAAALNAALSAASTALDGRGEVLQPRGLAKVSTKVTIPSNTTLRAPNGGAEIRGTGTDPTVEFAAGHDHQMLGVSLSAEGGGHVLNIPDAYNFTVRGATLVQYDTSKNVVHHVSSAGVFVDATFDKCTFNTAAGATVPGIHLENSANGLASTRWTDSRLNGSLTAAAPFIKIINTGVGNWAHDHTFKDITAELCPAGIIHAESVMGIVIDSVRPWDVPTYTDDIFKFTTNTTSGTNCTSVVVQNSGRRGGALASGKFDVNFSALCVHVAALFMSPSTAGEFYESKINLPTRLGVAIGCGSPFMQFAYGGALGLPTPSTVDRDSASASGVGAMAYDSTLGKPIWSDGTDWRDAAGTVV